MIENPMFKNERKLSVELLKKLIRLDAETGLIYWLPRDVFMFPDARAAASWNTRWAGKEALGSVSGDGHKHGTIFALYYWTHRVVFALRHGAWPDRHVDHINGDPIDNRPENLRVVTQQENTKNASLGRKNTSGVMGVSWDRQRAKWFASIRHDGRTLALGRYDSLDEARAARKAAERKYGFHENHGRAAA